MTKLERDHLLPMVPEVGFEVAMTLGCSSFFAPYIYYVFPYAINRYRGYCCIIIPVSFPRYCSPGYEATKFTN